MGFGYRSEKIVTKALYRIQGIGGLHTREDREELHQETLREKEGVRNNTKAAGGQGISEAVKGVVYIHMYYVYAKVHKGI